jgi:chromate reductase
MPHPVRLVGIAGSLREGSLNRALLRTVRDELLPAHVTLDLIEIGELPLYNSDLETGQPAPDAVARMRTQIAEADAVLFAMPEYNHSVPGLLQNAIDWASRPSFKSCLVGKPVGLMGVSPSPAGTARGQQVMKLTLDAVMARLMPHRGVQIGSAAGKFEDGRLADEKTRAFVAGYVESLASFARSLQPAQPEQA